MRGFLGTDTGKEFDRIVMHEILPAIAKAYSTIDVCVDAPSACANAVAEGIHNHFLKVVEDYAKNQLSYHLRPDCGSDDKTALKMKDQSLRMEGS